MSPLLSKIVFDSEDGPKNLRPSGFSTKGKELQENYGEESREMLVVLLLAFLCLVAGAPYYVPLQGVIGGKRTMVLLDKVEKKELYSQFFADLGTFLLSLLLS
jgi:hypothetical protein